MNLSGGQFRDYKNALLCKGGALEELIMKLQKKRFGVNNELEIGEVTGTNHTTQTSPPQHQHYDHNNINKERKLSKWRGTTFQHTLSSNMATLLSRSSTYAFFLSLAF